MPMQEPARLALCESEQLILKPNRLYVFEVIEGCKRCKELEDAGRYPGV